MSAATYSHRHAVRTGGAAAAHAAGVSKGRGTVNAAFTAAVEAARARKAAEQTTPATPTATAETPTPQDPPTASRTTRPAMTDARLAVVPAQLATRLAEIRADRRPSEVLTVADAAALLGLSPATVTRMRYRRGTKPARLVKVGRGVSRASVEALLNNR